MGLFDLFARRPALSEGLEQYRNTSGAVLLDVRTPEEFAHSHFPNSINLPLNKLDHSANQKLGNRNKTILVYCQSGARSKQATKLLYALGFTDVYNIGGLNTFIKRKP